MILMKKICRWSAFILSLGCLYLMVWYASAENNVERHIEAQLGVSLPDKLSIVSEDSHRGFHGDGTMLAVVTLQDRPGQNILWNQVNDKWNSLPIEEGIEETVREHWAGSSAAMPPLPEANRGRWFYRDRYQEKHGEICDFNPILQNCTFALFDQSSGQLYVLECDC